MAGKAIVLPTCHDPHECFAKAGNLCTALRDTYPRGTPCPFRKTYEDSVLVNGEELTADQVVERNRQRKAKREGKINEEDHEPDFWEMFGYCSEH